MPEPTASLRGRRVSDEADFDRPCSPVRCGKRQRPVRLTRALGLSCALEIAPGFRKSGYGLVDASDIDHSADLAAFFNARALTSDGPIAYRILGPDGAGLFLVCSIRYTDGRHRPLFRRRAAFRFGRARIEADVYDGVLIEVHLRSPSHYR